MTDFSLRLPGFSLQVVKYIDEKNHELRYVLKNRKTGEVYFVVLFTLILRDSSGNANNGSPNGTVNGNAHKENGGRGSLGKFDWEAEPSIDDVE